MALTGILKRLAQSLGFDTKNYVVFEGGLGSQLLAYILYKLRLESSSEILTDTSYFTRSDISRTKPDHMIMRAWALDHYGIELNSLNGAMRSRFRARLDPAQQSLLDRQHMSQARKRNWSALLPVTSRDLAFVEELVPPAATIACIHVRQGDYFSVSSRVISIFEALDFAIKIKELLPRDVYIVSDEGFPDGVQRSIQEALKDFEVRFVISGDQFGVHALLRRANILIASNSTFSFTAGLLSLHSSQLCFFPSHFFGAENRELNSLFSETSAWSIME